MRKLNVIKSPNRNSMLNWHDYKNPLIVVFNFIVIEIVKYIPALFAKRFLLRLLGVKVGKQVSVGLGVQFDIFFPELIEIGDNTILGYNATILCHEFLVAEFRKGPVKIGKNVMIGANSTILPGVTVGDNAVVGAMSLINKDVKTNMVVGGVPAREINKK